MKIDGETRDQRATNTQPMDPKALAKAVLERNKARNQCAIVTAQTAAAQCDMTVSRVRVVDFMTEAKRRGLIVRYRVDGSDTLSTVMPGPGRTTEQLREELTAQLGDRLLEVSP